MCELCKEQPATVLCFEKCFELAREFPNHKRHRIVITQEGVRANAMCPLHTAIPISLFCVDDTELQCTACACKGLHKGHKVINLSEVDEDNEVFSEAKVRERFEGTLKRGYALEKKITETIERVQKEGEDTKEKVTQSFREAHEKMNTEEAAVMEELEKACSEADEALQKAWTA